VIDTLLEALGADHVVVSGEGVREGLARSLARDSLVPTEAVRRSSLEALASRFVGWSGSGPAPGGLAAALHAALDPGATGEMAEALLQARGILDIGRTVDFFDRHEHVAISCSPPTSAASRTVRSRCWPRSCARRATRTPVRAPSPARRPGGPRGRRAGSGAPDPRRRDHGALPARLGADGAVRVRAGRWP